MLRDLAANVGNKAGEWRRQFGEQAITAAVLAGVFKLNNLRDAQHNNRIAIFWEHNLDPLREFVLASVRV